MESPKCFVLKKIRHYNTLAWPLNAENPISEDLNYKCLPGEDAPGPLYREILYPPQLITVLGSLSDEKKIQLLLPQSPIGAATTGGGTKRTTTAAATTTTKNTVKTATSARISFTIQHPASVTAAEQ